MGADEHPSKTLICSDLRGRMAAPAERLDPVLHHFPMLEPLGRNTATEVHHSVVHQAAKANRRCLLSSGKNVLMRSKPVNLIFRDHARGEAFKEQFTEGHLSYVTKLLHHDARSWPSRAQARIGRESRLAPYMTFF